MPRYLDLLMILFLIAYLPIGIYAKDYSGSVVSLITIIVIVGHLNKTIKNSKYTNEEIKPEEKYREVKPQTALMIRLVMVASLLLALNILILSIAFFSVITTPMNPVIISEIIFVGIAYVFAVVVTYEGFKEHAYQKRK